MKSLPKPRCLVASSAKPLASRQMSDGRWAGQCPGCGRWIVLCGRETMSGLVVTWPRHSAEERSQ